MARSAVDDVVAVARVPGEAVEVVAEVGAVVAPAAVDVVEVVAAHEHVVAGTAEQDVARSAAPQRHLHGGAGRAHEIAVAAPVHHELVALPRVLDLDEGEGADHVQGLPEAGSRDLLLLIRAVDREPVALPVAEVGVDLLQLRAGQVAHVELVAAGARRQVGPLEQRS